MEPKATAAVAALLRQAHGQSFPPGLYLVATPIGNLADVTVRAIAVLERADRIFCEDTRVTARLLDACGLSRRLETYHEHNAEKMRPHVLDAIADGQRVVLVSDAGTPLISDPGFKLVQEVAEHGFLVTAIPGASALTAIASLSGLPTDAIVFLGFLPNKERARRARLEPFAGLSATLIVYEAPGRLAATLSTLRDTLGDRAAVVGRELTKLHEEVRRGRLSDLMTWATDATLKGEIAIAVGPPDRANVAEIDDEAILTHLRPQLGETRLADAARVTAQALGVSRQRVYKLGLTAQDGDNG